MLLKAFPCISLDGDTPVAGAPRDSGKENFPVGSFML
ncbi:hypothetical protein SAMN05216212_1408 [Microbulbifer yueqingensis]|uniref:Uncharacterized protein n=1 Tax=Microbulbifer yueqingensis TaxID=658219 RepID=A0A1G8YAW7_9GAMM|nr:hypothetical protein SAMN05216212_1408 [Microbulbifer yueqingensis]